jgi:hypothetical protein
LSRLLDEMTMPQISNGLLPYAAPFTALTLARIGMRTRDLDLAAE